MLRPQCSTYSINCWEPGRKLKLLLFSRKITSTDLADSSHSPAWKSRLLSLPSLALQYSVRGEMMEGMKMWGNSSLQRQRIVCFLPLLSPGNCRGWFLPVFLVRSPCPMVNALANHGFLARDGVNVSLAQLITGFNASVNLAADATTLVGTKALTASTTGNAATFNLDDIDTHGSKLELHSWENSCNL